MNICSEGGVTGDTCELAVFISPKCFKMFMEILTYLFMSSKHLNGVFAFMGLKMTDLTDFEEMCPGVFWCCFFN